MLILSEYFAVDLLHGIKFFFGDLRKLLLAPITKYPFILVKENDHLI